MQTKRPIVIVGGGLAGLAAAQSMAAFGLQADIYEASPVLTEVGGAIGTSPQANKALQAVGLGEKLTAIATSWPGLYTRNMLTGELLEFRDLREAEARYGAPFYSFHRADLLQALASGLDPSTIHLGHRVAGVEELDNSVKLTFEDGTNVEADCVIGADGVRSTIRQALYGDDRPAYTGQMVWRSLLQGSLVPAECLEPHGCVQWIGPGRHLLAYYIRGTDIVNIVTQEDTAKWVAEKWSTRGDPDEMRLSFPDSEPRLRALLDLVTDCSKWGLFTRPLTPNWGRGRIQLIGDAAHAMLPNIGQGACQAFEDSYIIARWMEALRGNPIEAFANFRRVRIPRVHAIQHKASLAARFKHMHDAEAQKELLKSGKASTEGNMEWVLGYDPVSDWQQDPKIPTSELAN